MEKIKAALMDTYKALHLKPPLKGLIVTELASDTVQMVRVLMSRGLTCEEAEQASLEALLVTGEASTDMAKVHRGRMSGAIAEMSRGTAAAVSAILAVVSLAALAVVSSAGSIAGAAGNTVISCGIFLFISLVLFSFRGREIFLKNKAVTRQGDRIESLLKILASTAVSLPFLASAFELAGTDPLKAVFWLRTTSAMLSAGLASAILIFLMLIMIQQRKASLLTCESNFRETLESILEELK